MKKKFLILYIVIALILLCSNVYAAFTTNLVLDVNKATVNAGEDVIVSVSLKNVSENVTGVQGFIDVNEEVLSGVSEDMIVKNSDGKIEVTSEGNEVNYLSYVYAPTKLSEFEKDVVFNTTDSARKGHDLFFTEDFLNFDLNKDSVILKLKFTVKAGLPDGSLENAVSISGLTAESSKEVDGNFVSETVENLSADVTIVVKNDVKPTNNTIPQNTNTNTNPQNTNTNTNPQNTNTNTNPQNTNTNTNPQNTNTNTNPQNTNTNTNPQNTNTNTNPQSTSTNKNTQNTNTLNKTTNTNNKDNTVSANRLPATGAKTIIIPGLIISILGFISYKKYINFKEY